MIIEYRGYTINIEPDEYGESPREWDNLGTMVCFHRRYNLGDKHDFDSVNALEDYVKRDDVISLPLYLCDHSSITMSTCPFSSSWDSGQVGHIFVDKETVRKKYNWKNVTRGRQQRVEEYLESKVNTYDMYLTGEVFRYTIGSQQADILDSRGGYYGEDEALAAAKDSVDYIVKEKGEVT